MDSAVRPSGSGLATIAPGRSITVEVPATSANLGPGFDCFGLALSWRESVELSVTEGGYRVEVTGEGADSVPRDDSHLILRSALRGLADLGYQVPGLQLRCHNTIPHGRGLGSSSAAIVAGLLAAATLAGPPREEIGDLRRWLLRHANEVEGHPDNVAAAIYGGFVLAIAKADGLDAAVVPVHPDVRATLFIPQFPVPTKAARGMLPSVVPHRDAAANSARAALLVHALSTDPSQLHEGTRDWLHQDYREPVMPQSWALMTSLRGQGHGAVISGAGPTVLVLSRADDLLRLDPCPAGFRQLQVGIGAAASVQTARSGA